MTHVHCELKDYTSIGEPVTMMMENYDGTCPNPYWCEKVDGPRGDYPIYQPEKSEAKNDKDNL